MTQRTILITGGAGFIGSHVVRLFVNKYPEYKIINLDKLTYAGNLANLKDIEDKPNYKFVKMDICDFEGVYQLMQDEQVDGIIHLAAESHVDRSIKDPFTFARTNVMGTLSLLQAAKLYWESQPVPYKVTKTQSHKDAKNDSESLSLCDSATVNCLFYHISTDEVYGALEMNHPEGVPAPFHTKASAHRSQLTAHGTLAYGSDFFYETTKYNPHSPYSASKASSDHFVRAYHDTYGMPTIVTNCSNNYGPYQFPEKLIPLFINNIRNRKPLPVYGKGENVRDWLYVEDHARAIDLIFHKGKIAETYNIGGFNEWKNIDLIKVIIKTVDIALGRAVSCQLSAVSNQTQSLLTVVRCLLTNIQTWISSPSSPTDSVTTHVMPLTRLSYSRNSVGSQVFSLKKALRRQYAGISTTKTGWITSPAATTRSTMKKCTMRIEN